MLTNFGTVIFEQFSTPLGDGVRVVNEAGALVRMDGDGALAPTTGKMEIVNKGTLRKTSAANTPWRNNVTLYNYGVVDVAAGTLTFELPATTVTGTFKASSPSSVIQFVNGIPSGGAVLAGPGSVVFTGGTLDGYLTVDTNAVLRFRTSSSKYLGLNSVITNYGTIAIEADTSDYPAFFNGAR